LNWAKISRNIDVLHWEDDMVAYNIVRFRVKPDHQDEFVAQHRKAKPHFKGFRSGALVKTGEQTFCFVGEWTNFKAIARARPEMIGLLDTFREHLEDLGNGLGVSDPVSGEMVAKIVVPKPTKRNKTKGKRKKRF
jgi:hypothetical protein